MNNNDNCQLSSLTNTILLTTSILFLTPQNIQITMTWLGRFQLRWDLLQTWLSLTLVSDVQIRVDNLALINNNWWWLPTFISHRYYIDYHLYRISNSTKYRWYAPFWVDSNWARISYKLDWTLSWYVTCKNVYIIIFLLTNDDYDDDCQLSSLTDTILFTTSIVFPTPHNTDYSHSFTGTIPTEIGSLTSL